MMKYKFMDAHGVMHFAKDLKELQQKMIEAREN